MAPGALAGLVVLPFAVGLSGCGYIGAAVVGALAAQKSGGGSSGAIPPTPPSVASVTPASGTHGGGTAITIAGKNFTPDAGVTIGGVAATNVVVSDDATI